MTWWVKACENEIIKSVSRLSRDIKLGSKVVTIATGWDVITAVEILWKMRSLGYQSWVM